MNSSIWTKIENGLISQDKIRNWTKAKGYLGDSFTVMHVGPNSLLISSPKAKNDQLVPKRDFEALDVIWEDYKKGKVQRQQIRDMTRFSKYIISILKHLEN